jgi:hypothetical protein
MIITLLLILVLWLLGVPPLVIMFVFGLIFAAGSLFWLTWWLDGAL